MKRSQVNKMITEAIAFIEKTGFKLPPFAYFTPEEWAAKGSDYAEAWECNLGWDITDFGLGDFEKTGLLMFTIRNGSLHNDKYVKPYSEKILLVGEEQTTPFHYHVYKYEDIINRGGGNLLVTLYNTKADGTFDDTMVDVAMDGRNFQVKAGEQIKLVPGESIFLKNGDHQYHSFIGEKGTGKVLLIEVSSVNDDTTDNIFYDNNVRSPFEEDEPAKYVLVGEYKK